MTLYHPQRQIRLSGDIQDARFTGVRCFDEQSE